MKRRHVLASMGAFTASGSAIISSGAFTSVEAERTATVTIVEDEDAYVGLEYEEEVSGAPEDTDLDITDPDLGATVERRDEDAAMITNQFTVDVEVEIEGSDGFRYEPSDGSEQPVTIETGESQEYDAVFDCGVDTDDDTREEVFTVTAEGTGGEVSGELERMVDVTCEGVESIVQGVIFRGGGGVGDSGAGPSAGSGNVHVQAPTAIRQLSNVTVWVANSDGPPSSEGGIILDRPGQGNADFNISNSLLSGLSGSNIIGVYIGDVDTTYLHPNLVLGEDGVATLTGKGSNEPTDCIQSGFVDLTDATIDCTE